MGPVVSLARWRRVGGVVGAAFLYKLGMDFGYLLSFPPDHIAVFWPPNGIAVAILLLARASNWWMYLLAFGTANVFHDITYGWSATTGLLFFLSNALQMLIAAAGLRMWLGEAPDFGRMAHLVRYLFVVVATGPILSAFAGAAVVILSDAQADFWATWQHWALGSVMAHLTLTPTLVVAAQRIPSWWRDEKRPRIAEGLVLGIGLAVVAGLAFSGLIGTALRIPTLVYLPLPFLLWAALRFGPGGVFPSLLLIEVVAAWFAVKGHGFFAQTNAHEAAISIQRFMLAFSLPPIVLAAIVQEHRRAEESLRLSENRFRGLFENSPDAVVVEDAEGRVLDANPAACHLHKLTRDQLVGRNVLDLVPREMREAVSREFPRWFTGELTFYEGYTHTTDGRTIPVEIRGAPISYQGRNAVLLHVRDNSARNQMREQLLQSQKMEAVGRLAGGVAHDFNNLLMVIGGWTELAMAKPDDREHTRRWQEEVRRAVEKGAALARQLLAFSRRQVIQPEALDLAALVEKSRQMLQTMLGEHSRIEVHAERIGGCVWMDPMQATQILMNLASNARDAMGDRGGTLSFEVSQTRLGPSEDGTPLDLAPGNYARLVVRDTGCGMDQATKGRVFEPFFTTKSQGKGTGLGLSTVYGIVRQAGGDISVASTPGAGTTFTILLPLAEKPQPPASPPSEEGRGLRGNETILLVEDEDGVRSSVEETLRSAGYRVISVADGRDAWSACQQGKGEIHLLLTDVIMPGLRGDDLARRVKNLQPKTRVILMSGYLDERIHPETLSSEGFTFVQKPVKGTELLRRIRESLDAAS